MQICPNQLWWLQANFPKTSCLKCSSKSDPGWPSKRLRAKGQDKHPWSEKNVAANRLVRQPPALGSEAHTSLWLKAQPSGVSPTEHTRLGFRVCGKFQACMCSHWVQTRANGILPGLSSLTKIGRKMSASYWTERGGNSIRQIALFSTYTDIAHIVVVSAGEMQKCLVHSLSCTSPAPSPLTQACWSHFWSSKPKQHLLTH